MSSDKTLEIVYSGTPNSRPETTNPCLIVVDGPEEGVIYSLEEGCTILGRSRDQADIILSGQGISRAHAKIEFQSGKLTVTDLDSTNGIFVNGLRLQRTELKGGDQVGLGSNALLQVSFQDQRVRNLIKNLYRDATLDELTGVFNRKSFLARLETGTIAALAIVDIDDFKKVNDTHGHSAGDNVLAEVAQRLRQNLGQDGIVGRLGGEEFILLINRPLDEAKRKCEEIRKGIASRNFRLDKTQDSQTIEVTVSIGLTNLGENIQDTIERADSLLYQAKSSGKNSLNAQD